jgi:hypothetical protein
MDSEQHGTAQEPAEVPGAYLVKVAADATAMTARARAALDEEAVARGKAGMSSFGAAMEKLRTDPGVSAGSLSILAAGILGAASAKLEEVNGEAAELARTTLFSYADWLAALECIDGHPRRDAILGVLRDAAGRSWNPRLLARDLAESGILADRGLWKPAVWERTLRRCEQATAPAFLFCDPI